MYVRCSHVTISRLLAVCLQQNFLKFKDTLLFIDNVLLDHLQQLLCADQ